MPRHLERTLTHEGEHIFPVWKVTTILKKASQKKMNFHLKPSQHHLNEKFFAYSGFFQNKVKISDGISGDEECLRFFETTNRQPRKGTVVLKAV